MIVFNDKKVISLEDTKGKVIKNLVLMEGVEVINERAFSLQKISKLVMPKSLKIIKSYAFSFNPLESLRLNDGIEEIGNNAFEECMLREVVIPGSVRYIGEKAFSNNPLEKVIIDANSLMALEYEDNLYDIFGKSSKIEVRDLSRVKKFNKKY